MFCSIFICVWHTVEWEIVVPLLFCNAVGHRVFCEVMNSGGGTLENWEVAKHFQRLFWGAIHLFSYYGLNHL